MLKKDTYELSETDLLGNKKLKVEDLKTECSSSAQTNIGSIDDAIEEQEKFKEKFKEKFLKLKSEHKSKHDELYRDIHHKFSNFKNALSTNSATLDVNETKESLTDAALRKFLENDISDLYWLSHEGSTIICALIAVANGECKINILSLPDGDKTIIDSYTLSKTKKTFDSFFVKFDKYKNFEFQACETKDVVFVMGNRVISIPPNERKCYYGSDIKIERRGKDVIIGDKIKLDPVRIQNLAQTEQKNENKNGHVEFQKKSKVAGRNAYEIRQDIVDNAIEIIRLSSNASGKNYSNITDDILEIAERLCDFVEHKK